jgi:hypothetical protein
MLSWRSNDLSLTQTPPRRPRRPDFVYCESASRPSTYVLLILPSLFFLTGENGFLLALFTKATIVYSIASIAPLLL